MNVPIGELRYKCSGSYVDPGRHQFTSSEWLTNENCRSCVSGMLVDADFKRESIRIIVQIRKSRWVFYKAGYVFKIFPDITMLLAMQEVIHGMVDDAPLTRRQKKQVESAIRHSKVREMLAEARQLVFELEKLQHVLSI